MDTGNVAELSEEQIRELLAAKQRAERLKSLQRVAAAQPSRKVSAPRPGDAFNLPLPLDTRGDAETRRRGDARRESRGTGERRSGGAREQGSRGAEEQRGRGGAATASVSAPARLPTPVPQSPRPLAPGRSPGGRGPGATRPASGPVRKAAWGVWRDRALLLVEVAALLALIFVLAGSFSSLGVLNQEIVEARRAQPATTAVPMEDVLPGSSFPPALNGEMPAPLRGLVRSGAPVPIPTPGPQAATRIVIPAIGVDSVIVEGDTWEDLKKGVGHHLGTANPGERGNAVYSGHNDVYGEVFRRLDELKPGDTITMYAGIHLYRYEIKRVRFVSPQEVSVMAPTPDATLTLITCYPYRVDTQRVIIIAKLVE